MGKKRSLKKQYKLQQKRVRKLKNHPFVIPVATFLVLFFVTLVAFIAFSGTTVGAGDSRIVRVFVDGQQQVVPTRAPTVKSLLQRLHITLHKNDIVEPSLKALILEDNFQVNIYRARPVTIIDGDKKVTLLTAKQTPQAVAKQAGISVQPEDAVTLEQPNNLFKEGVIGEEVVINRAIAIKLVLYGKPYDVYTHAKTVRGLLAEKDIDPKKVTVFPPPAKALKQHDTVFVTVPGKTIVSSEESIHVPDETISDPSLPLGTTRVRQQGVVGKKVVIYEVDPHDKSKKQALQTIIAVQAVPKITVQGSKVALSGSKVDWMKAAGIHSSDYVYVDFIISHESGWQPARVSANRCIGLGQRCNPQILISACPSWQTDPVCQLKHFNGYAQKYGSWGGAYSFWQANHWW